MSGNTLAWQLEAVLPNLQPDAAFEFSSLVIVPNSDSRLDAIRSRNKAARALLDGFSDQRGTALKPAAVIFRVANPFRDRWRSILGASNMLDVECSLNGRQHTI